MIPHMAKILQENRGEPSVKNLRDMIGPRLGGVWIANLVRRAGLFSKFYACAGVFCYFLPMQKVDTN
jgi:hypothetical protein